MSTTDSETEGVEETTNNTTLSTDENEPSGPPLNLILVVGIIGASIFIVLIIAVLVMICSIGIGVNKAKRKKSKGEPKCKHKETNYTPNSRPLYAQVIRPDGSLRRQRDVQSLSPVHIEEEQTIQLPSEPQPREVLAYSINAPNRFRPLPPPPVVSGQDPQTLNTPRQLKVYSSPSESTDGGSSSGYVPQSFVTGFSGTQTNREDWNNPDTYYDKVEVVHHERSSLTSSLQPLMVSTSANSDTSESYYQRPNSRPATLPRKKPNVDYDYTYNESLEPSMLQTSVSFESGQALPYAPIYDTPQPLRNSERPLEISRKNVVEIRNLGFGHFGKVVLGATTGLSLKDLKLGDNDDKSCSLLVAIKKLRNDADSSLKTNFQKELKFISRLKHANVVRLLGICTAADDSFLIMEYMENGDLHSFLSKRILVADTVDALGENDVTPLILLYISVQIASGMRYLASKKFVHRDLATRNCLVGRDFVIKISDFGMSCSLYSSLYYRVQGRLILPIRWMAYECFYGKFSVKSDIWAFGIVVWEIYTFAKNEPYSEMTDEEYICDAIKGANRKLLAKPDICSNDIYDVMQRCWVHEPSMRADFEEIYSRLFLTYTRLSNQTG